MESLQIHLVQFDMAWENIPFNLSKAETLLAEVKNSQLIVLPEMFNTGFSMNTSSIAEKPFAQTFEWMREEAKKRNTAICGSFAVNDKGKFYNRMHFVLPNGSYHIYDKKHLFSLAGEQHSYSAGAEIKTIDYLGWKISLAICYDLRFPVFLRNTKKNAYDLMLLVASWPKKRIEAWNSLLKARAIENQAYVVGVNRFGTDGNQIEYNGGSAVYNPFGEALAFNNTEEIVLAVNLSKTYLDETRKNLPFLNDADSFDLH